MKKLCRSFHIISSSKLTCQELVSKELNHMAAILHVYFGFDFYEVEFFFIIFQKEKGNTFTLLIIFIVKSLQKEQNKYLAQIYYYDP